MIAGAVRTESTPIPPGEAIEAQLVTPKRPRQLWLHSWLSRNQEPIALTLREARGDEMPEEFVSSRPSDWRPSPSSAIVVDDLDSGFSVADLARRRPAVYGPRRYDRGLPAFEYSTREVPGAWYRWGAPTAWGRFRRTVAQLIPGRKDRQLAVFSARLPGTPSGRWRLDYHIPWRLPPPTFAHLDHVGQTRLTIQTAAGNPVATVESDFVAGGWNVVGVFDVPEGDVEVRVSGSSDASLVVADAIRWSRNEEDKETQSG